MEELGHPLQFPIALDTLLEEVLHGLDIVVGGALDIFDPPGRFQVEVLDDPLQNLEGMGT